MRRHHILIPLAALLAVFPLILHGCSCGHDFTFHLQSWLDAAQQMRHGTLYPQWAFSPAWNAGEPRFVFYPPLSWMLGALLTLLFPVAALPALYTWIALTAAGFAMHRLARTFTSPNAALLGAVLYLANPYMLFTAFERTAYAELLAAAWIPLLLLAALRRRPTIPGIAIPIALLWLTNAPAAVMGCYTFALLAVIRLSSILWTHRKTAPRSGEAPAFALRYLAGTALGLALPAFYLVPAAYERRYVQIAMAIIPNMRFQDNFLFGHTADTPHNVVLRTASLLAVTLLALTFLATVLLFWKSASRPAADSSQLTAHRESQPAEPPAAHVAASLLLATLLLGFLLLPASTPLWNHLPDLAFLQFPWRLLSILSAILAFSLALLFHHAVATLLRAKAAFATPLAALVLALLAISLYRQPCDDEDSPAALAQAFGTHHGVAPTDEYTPTQADNDVLRANDPAWWLSPSPEGFAPSTTPNPAATDPTWNSDDPPADTLSGQPPAHFTVHVDTVQYLILNLRDYPHWDITDTPNHQAVERPVRIIRDDGLLTIPVFDSGDHTIDLHWRRTPDQNAGLALSLGALLLLPFTRRRRPRA